MRRPRAASRFACAAGFCLLVWRSAQAFPGMVQEELSRFAASPQSRGLSFCVVFARVYPAPRPEMAQSYSPDTSSPMMDPATVAHGADRPLVPASLAKLATTALALERLGPAYTFHTRILTRGRVQDGVLHGDLIVQGGGDPYLVSERLWLLANQVRESGLRRVQGNLVVDGSRFAPAAQDPSRAQGREVSSRPYGARLSALAVNFNAAAVRLAPAEAAGAPALAAADPLPCSYLHLSSALITGARGSKETWTARLLPDGAGETLRLEGSIPAGAAAQTVYRSVADPDRFSASLLRAFLEQAGVAIEGSTTAGTAPEDARLRCDFPSLPLSDLLRLMNQNSNNFMADLIAMSLGALPERAGDPGDSGRPDSAAALQALDLTRGGAAITRWLRSEFGGSDTVRLLDGSGLNPGDRLTGSVLLRLLYGSWRDLRLQPDFVASLAVPGDPGTLRQRFENRPAIVLRAKSGTMGEPLVSGLAGYLQDPKRKPIAFVILMNADAGSGWDLARMQALQEAWIEEYVRL